MREGQREGRRERGREEDERIQDEQKGSTYCTYVHVGTTKYTVIY